MKSPSPRYLHNRAIRTLTLEARSIVPRLLFVMLVVAATAQAGPAVAQSANRSDAIILVQPSGSDMFVAVTYSAVSDHAEAKQRLSALAKAAGWTSTNFEIKDETIRTSPTFGDSKAIAKQTDASTVFKNAYPAKQGGFILQPFVQAFSDLRRIELLFFIPKSTDFVGLHDFEDPALSVHLVKDGGPYQYVIEFKDRSKPLPVLPHTQSVEQPAQAAPAAAAAPPPKRTLSMAFVVVVAAASGLVVLGALLILSGIRGQSGRTEPRRASRPRRT